MSAPETPITGGPLATILALPNDSVKKTLFMAFSVCFVCSIVVATAAVGLRPQQLANQEADRIRNIVEVAGILPPGANIMQAYEQIEVELIKLDDGSVSDAYDATTFDIQRAAKDPAMSHALKRKDDPAGLKRRPDYMPIYMVKDDSGKLKTLILPVYGAGLWSTLYGFLALDGDLRTAHGLKFYQHAETPGLGGEVDNPKWRALWQGKVVYDAQWTPRIELVKGSVDTSLPGSEHKVDGLAGATLTSRGVTQLISYWLGEHGYGPLITRLRNERG